MNYIFVHLLNDMSGSPRVLSDLISNFPIDGRKVLITNRTGGFLDEKNVDIFFRIPYEKRKNRYFRLFSYVLNQILILFFLSLFLIFEKCKGNKSTVVINTLLPFGAAIAARVFGDRVIYYIHETYISPRYLNWFLSKISLLVSDQIVFVSEYVKSFHLSLSEGVACKVVYNPLRNDFNYTNRSAEKKFSERYLLYVGTLNSYKGIHIFIELSRMISDRNFIAVVNAEKEELEDFISSYEIPANLFFKRRPSNLDEIYNEALFTLNLSLPNVCIETFGLTLLESMSFSVPVIAPNYGGPKEIVNKQVGFLIEPENIVSIKEIILSIDEKKWNMMSSNALLHSRSFSLEKYIDEIKKIF
ncbi:TPA: glycosyltransferase family 4 protein [Aeromonas veronii]